MWNFNFCIFYGMAFLYLYGLANQLIGLISLFNYPRNL